MKIFVNNKKQEEIHSLEDWKNFFTKTDSKGEIHWKKGRSAETLASFIIEKNGAEKITQTLSSVFSGEIVLKYAIPEFEVRFDSFKGNGRKHDLGIVGTIDGKSLFIGVEAKVDEEFGPTVAEEYTTATIKRWNGESTNIPERVVKLLTRFYADGIPTKAASLRYQLFTALAGTCDAKSKNKDFDYYVFLVLEFNTGTDTYDPIKAKENHKDFSTFLSKINAKNHRKYHKKTLGNKDIYIVYMKNEQL